MVTTINAVRVAAESVKTPPFPHTACLTHRREMLNREFTKLAVMVSVRNTDTAQGCIRQNRQGVLDTRSA